MMSLCPVATSIYCNIANNLLPLIFSIATRHHVQRLATATPATTYPEENLNLRSGVKTKKAL